MDVRARTIHDGADVDADLAKTAHVEARDVATREATDQETGAETDTRAGAAAGAATSHDVDKPSDPPNGTAPNGESPNPLRVDDRKTTCASRTGMSHTERSPYPVRQP